MGEIAKGNGISADVNFQSDLRNGDRNPDVTHVDAVESHFALILDPPEPLD